MTSPFSLAALTLAGGDWLGLSTALFAVGALLIYLGYRKAPGSRGLRIACATLKLIALALIALCLLEPQVTGRRPKPGENAVAVLVDTSASMTLQTAAATESEAEAALRHDYLGPTSSPWRTLLAQDFAVHDYAFDTQLRRGPFEQELSFQGTSSNLFSALRDLQVRNASGMPLSAIILMTDGNATDPEPAAAELAGLPPIYLVAPPMAKPKADAAIEKVSVTSTQFEDAPVTVQATIATEGMAGREITGRLRPLGAGTEEETKSERTFATAEGETGLRFQFRPTALGVQFYRLDVSTAEGEEATLKNNQATIAVNRGGTRQRILYVGGRPSWEYKFLRRSLEEEPRVELAALLRIARREPKFAFRGRAGETTNPLFRGFGNKDPEETEQYDQPVLIRLGTRDENELRSGFPKTADELFQFSAVILDDVEADFFTTEQMVLLRRFVSQRGGSLLMLGGADSFAAGRYQRTPIGDMLPIYMDGPSAPMRSDEQPPLRLELTREGMLQAWARLRTTEREERERLAAAPPFDVQNPVGDGKPAASIVATSTGGAQEEPALAIQPFGRGRTAALTLGDFWQAGFGDEVRGKDLARAWRQMARWLVGDVPERVELRTVQEGPEIKIEVRVRTAEYEPADTATVALTVRRAGEEPAQPITLSPEPSLEEPGLFTARYVPRESGAYLLEAKATQEDGAAIGTAQFGWTTNLERDETRSLRPNLPLLERLAAQTGGAVLPASDLERLARELPTRRAPVEEVWSRPLWHTPFIFLLALALLGAEWILRRRIGLA